MTTTFIEHVTYQLNDGVTDAQLAEANEGVNNFLTRQSGFLYRSNSALDNTLYDIVYWQTEADAQKASNAFCTSEEGQALVALTKEGTVSMNHMPVTSEAMICEESA